MPDAESAKPTATILDPPIEDIPIDRVIVDPQSRRRQLNEAAVEQLMEAIKSNGLLYPIIVARIEGSDLVALVAGWHRLEACKRLRHERINCKCYSGLDATAREEIEIIENVARAELSSAERSEQLLRLKEIYEARHPETKKGAQGGGRGGKGTRRRTGSVTASFSKSAAAKTGRSPRSVERDVRRAKQLGPDILKRIKGTSFDSPAEMDALAALPEKERAKLIERAERGEKVSAVVRGIASKGAAAPNGSGNGAASGSEPNAPGESQSIVPLFARATAVMNELSVALTNDGARGELKRLPVDSRKEFMKVVFAASAPVKESLEAA
jgi:ParB-like chromosome segregation protein Spo0J